MSFDLIVKGGILPNGNTTEPKGSVFFGFRFGPANAYFAPDPRLNSAWTGTCVARYVLDSDAAGRPSLPPSVGHRPQTTPSARSRGRLQEPRRQPPVVDV
jgi:hypothetical protein